MAGTRRPRFSARGWTLRRVQLFGALLFAVAIPAGVAVLLTPDVYGSQLWTTSVLGSCIAIVASSYFFYNMAALPGTRSDYHVLPVYTASFGVLFAVLLFARLEYSRPLLLASYLISMAWQFIGAYLLQTRRRLALAVVPFGQVDSLREITSVRWIVLGQPKVPGDCRAIVADFNSDLPAEWEEFLASAALNGIPVFHHKQLRQTITGQVEIEHLSENANGTLIPSGSFLLAKQLVDTGIALAALIPLAVLFLIVGLVIKLDSRGPVFFTQERVGYRGRTFRIWKFRTMTAADREHGLEDAKTVDADPRVTRVGRFLRRSRIDELPQVINVMRGDMSWIGPRPEVLVLSQWYQAEIPFYRYRHIVRPGITGWAQVNQGHVAELGDISHKLNFDFYYISRFSVWLDVLIIVRTIKTMLTGFGAR